MTLADQVLVNRDGVWSALDQEWDVVIIGGGITGASILRMAVQSGLKAILFEARDFSYGTSSRSSKLVHGGLRYLKNGQIDVTRESVRERDRMLREAPDLVSPLRFIIPNHLSEKSAARQYHLGIIIYDLLGRKWRHGSLPRSRVAYLFPQVEMRGLLGALYYFDAEADDSRLVLRLLRDAVRQGGAALNHAPVVDLLKTGRGAVCGVRVEDRSSSGAGRSAEVRARVVINATGPWTDDLRACVNALPCIRKQRGSHLVFSAERLHVPCAMTMVHPRDRRTMFIIPWEGVTVVGTTDLDHTPEMESRHAEPCILAEEVDYILEAVQDCLPGADLHVEDVLATFAGLRPIVSTGGRDPSRESRRHVILAEDGLVTITGGKLTTCRAMAEDVLRAVQDWFPRFNLDVNQPLFEPASGDPAPGDMPSHYANRVFARYGDAFLKQWQDYASAERQFMPGLPYTWAELDWSARNEAVEHLDDLLLRRIRIGLLAKLGGTEMLPRIKRVVQPALGWDDERWMREAGRYLDLWRSAYGLP